MDFKYDGGFGKGGTASLFINDKKSGRDGSTRPWVDVFGVESLDVGMDNGSPVSENYEPPCAYAGTIKKITINIQPSTLSASDLQVVRDAERAAALGIE
jgi:hypothetical protein